MLILKKIDKYNLALMPIIVTALFLILLSTQMLSFFSDITANSAQLETGNLNINVDSLLVEDNNNSMAKPDENGFVQNSLFEIDSVKTFRFKINNNGLSASKLNTQIGVTWTDDKLSEAGNIFIYPSDISNEDIISQIKSGNDMNALSKHDINDQSIIKTSAGDRKGFIITVDDQTILDSPLENGTKGVATTPGATNKIYEFKLVFSFYSSEGIQITDYDNELLETNVFATGNSHNSSPGWTDTDNAYFQLITQTDATINEPPIISPTDETNFDYFIGTEEPDLTKYATAFDAEDGDITDNISFTSSPELNMNIPGDYTISYNVTDSAGNQAKTYKIKIIVWNFTKIDSGNYSTIALTSHGKVYSWGYGANYRLGTGSTSDAKIPTRLKSLEDVKIVDIAAGYESGYAVDDEGNLWSWGSNSSGRLGDGTTITRQNPTKISPPYGKKYTQVSAFYATGAALANDGTVYSWGWEGYGANGHGQTGDKTSPTQLTQLSNIVKIDMGYYNGAAIDNEGNLWNWGTNGEGQLGAGSAGSISSESITTYYNTPGKYSGLTNITDIAYGVYHAASATTDGDVYTWGNNAYGRIGNGTASTNQYTPTVINTGIFSGATSVTSSMYGSSAITGIGKSYFWGSNNYGEIFTGSTSTSVAYPSENILGTSIIYSSLAIDSSFVLTSDGKTVYGVGYGGNYVLGNNSTSSTSSPVKWGFISSS